MNFAKTKMSFRWQLILSLCSLIALVLILGYWLLFARFQNELERDFDQSLYNYTADLLQNVEINSTGQADISSEVIFNKDKVFPFPHGDALVKIYNYNFDEIFSYTMDQNAPVNLSQIQKDIEAHRDNQFRDLVSDFGEEWRGLLVQLDDSPDPQLYFFVAVPKYNLNQQVRTFKSIFIFGEVVIILLCAFAISITSKRILTPLEKLNADILSTPFLHQMGFLFEDSKNSPPEVSNLINALNELLKRINQTLGAHEEFVDQAAHQLKTPLTIARGQLEMFLQQNMLKLKETKISLADINTAISEIDYMSRTITNLLSLVQIESGFQSVKFEKFDFLDHVLKEVDRLDHYAKSNQMKFLLDCKEFEGGGEHQWEICSDPQLISVVLTNLIENAIKYASVSPVKIDLINESAHVIFKVSNSFESTDLYQINGEKHKLGHGLGLYIVQKIATLVKIKTEKKLEDGKFEFSIIISKSLI